MDLRRRLRKFLPYIGALGVAVICLLLVASVFFTALDLNWVAFLGGVLIAACIALASRASHAAWTIARRTSQLAAARGKVASLAQAGAQAQRRIAALEAELASLDELPAMIALFDRERRIRYRNKAYVEGAAEDVRLDEAFAGATVRHERTDRSGGRFTHLAVQYLPRFGEGGQVTGVFAILTDVTSRQDVAGEATAAAHAPVRDELAAERLRRALDENQFTLFQQPIAALRPGPSTPFTEVFLRLVEEEENLMSPGAFLPLAEELGLLPQLDGWVVRHVHEWVRGDPLARKGTYSLNLSAASIASAEFRELVVREVRASGPSGPVLCFEFSEAEAMQQPDQTRALMRALRKEGCRFALSGFGRDPASFDVVKALEFDYLKIDASLALRVWESPADQAKVKAINRLAHDIGARTIAVCVESRGALAEIRKAGTDFAQGFLLGRPMPLESRNGAAAALAAA